MIGTWRQPTIEQARTIQFDAGLSDRHLVWLGPAGFVIAHTDRERVEGMVHRCALHTYLVGCEEQPHPTGWYVVQLIAGGWRFDQLGPILESKAGL